MQSTKILADVVQSATAAKVHFEVWWAQASEAKPKLVTTMNRHSDFFHASHDAHYTAFFVYFAHLFDKRADSSSIPTYLSIITPLTDTARISYLQEKYAELVKRATPLLIARHKTVAHIDGKLSEKDVFGQLGVTWNEIRDVIYDSATYVAELAGTKDLGSIGIPRDRRLIDSTLKLINALRTS